MGLKFRLTVMNFLQFFVWGAWLISLGGYMGQNFGPIEGSSIGLSIGRTLAFFGMGYDTSFYYDIWLWGDTTDIIIQDTTIAIQSWQNAA